MGLLDQYAEVAGADVVAHLRQLAEPLKGLTLVHVNSTRLGGGVAEILHKMVPLMCDLGLNASWEVISGEPLFYQCTKAFHNGMQGSRVAIGQDQLAAYEKTNTRTAEQLGGVLDNADVVIVHDPQPAALITHFPHRRGKWVWRCHIDASRPLRSVWQYLRQFIVHYDASIFSLSSFAQRLPHPIYLIPPSIDPFHEKNIPLGSDEIDDVRRRFAIDPQRPTICQISRYDRFKDPVGVIQAYKLARRFVPSLQLVLAGGGASDDPEGDAVLAEVQAAAKGDAGIKVLLLPGDVHRTINALQRASDIVVQKSVREGFGLTVTEAMWKLKPVIGGDTGGIRTQVINHHTGFLVNSPEGAALRIRYLLHNPGVIPEMGAKARVFVRDNFLITRHLTEYLALILALRREARERIQLA